MNNKGVYADSDTEAVDPNLPSSWEFKRQNRQKMDEEDDEVYGDAEKNSVFRFLDSSDPQRARRRLGTLYWKAWKRVLMAFFLTAFGITFTIIGIACMKMCDEPERGLGFLVCGLLVLLPGCYGTCTLLWYLRGYSGYHYKDLPTMD
jgi:hypothetical protein